jgi:hypothetical protein
MCSCDTIRGCLTTADVFAIMGVRMFRDMLPSKFGSMYTASFTLFQLITLDDWFELYDEIRVAEASAAVAAAGSSSHSMHGAVHIHDGVHPVFLYFFVFIVTENFIFVNLFTAVIVNNLELHQQKQLRASAGTSASTSARVPTNRGRTRGGGAAGAAAAAGFGAEMRTKVRAVVRLCVWCRFRIVSS